jgi:cytochrome d ubiquinol oxidase subunit II
MQYVGAFFTLLNPYAIVGGLTTLLVFMFHGALFLCLKTTGEMAKRASKAAQTIALVAIPVVLLMAGLTYFQTDLYANLGAAITLIGS